MTTVPEPPQTMPPGLSEEQQGALQTVQTYFALLDQAQKDPEFNMTPLTILFAKPEAAIDAYFFVRDDRENERVKVGDLIYHYEPVGEVVEAAGLRSVSVRLCVDATNAEPLNPDGTSALDSEQTGHSVYDFDVVQTGDNWQINGFIVEEAKRC